MSENEKQSVSGVLLSGPTSESKKASKAAGTGKSPSQGVETFRKTDLEIERFVQKLTAWLPLQYEWAHILAMPRSERKKLGKALADCVTTAPTVDTSESIPRAFRRAIGLR